MQHLKKCITFALAKQNNHGAIAQLVEQRTENPCVPGSIPGGTTVKAVKNILTAFLRLYILYHTKQPWCHSSVGRAKD